MSLSSVFYIILYCLFTVSAIPITPFDHNTTHTLSTRGEVSELTEQQISELLPYVQFARTGYCSFGLIASWSCGEPCDAVAPVIPLSAGGDGFGHPNWHILYWKAGNALVIVHEGTSPDKISSIAVDLRLYQKAPKKSLFLNAPYTAWVHHGFQQAFKVTAKEHAEKIKYYLNGVRARDEKDGKDVVHMPQSVVTVGYSMGGAVALLNALYLRQQLPENIRVRTISVGSPMVGNVIFTRWADQVLSPAEHNNIRIANHHDIVPRLPAYVPYEYFHAGVEYRVQSDGVTWTNCGSQRNQGTNPLCSTGLTFNIQNHYWVGPLSMLDVCDRAQQLNIWSQWP